MTTYTGKDVIFKINTAPVARSQEVSFDINNGQTDVKELGLATIKEFAYTQQDVSGSFSVIHTSYDMINDVMTSGTTKTLALEFGSIPDWTLTFSNVYYGTYDITFSLEEPVASEISYKAETASVA